MRSRTRICGTAVRWVKGDACVVFWLDFRLKEVALYDAKNALSALIQEVEDTGQDIVITRHGKPAAKLSPASPPARRDRVEALARLAAIQAEAEKTEVAKPDWPTIKRWAQEEPDPKGAS